MSESNDVTEATRLGELFDKSVRVQALYLSNAMVLAIGDDWPKPDGDPLEPVDFGDGEGPKQIKVAAILEIPDEASSGQEDDGLFAITRKAHFKVFPDQITIPCRMLKINESKVVWAEYLVPPSYVQEQVTSNIEDNVVVDDGDDGDEEESDATVPAPAPPAQIAPPPAQAAPTTAG